MNGEAKTALIWAPIAQHCSDFPEFTNDVQTNTLSEEEEEADLSARLSGSDSHCFVFRSSDKK